MLAVILYPPDIKAEDSYEVFERNRKWLFGAFFIVIALDVAQTAVRGQLFEPEIYLPFLLHYAARGG